MKDYILARAVETSTWRGIFMLLGACGLVIAPGIQEAITIIATTLASSGVVGIVTPEQKAGE